MNSNFAKALGFGVLAVAVIVGAIFFIQRGAHVDLQGEAKVRTLSTSEHESMAIVDLHLINPASYPFVIRDITVTIESDAGNATSPVAARGDTERFFAATPQSGPYHPAFYSKVSVPGGATVDYTALAGFSMPEKMLKDGKRFRVTVTEVDGKAFEFVSPITH